MPQARVETMKNGKRALPILVMLLLWAGCSGVMTRPDSPRVSLVDMRVEEVSLLETSCRAVIRILNPGDAAIRVRGISCDLDLNGESFATGVSPLDVTVPSFGTETVEVLLYSSNLSLLREAMGLPQRQNLEYRLRGKLRLDDGKALTPSVPFSAEGRLSLKTAEGQDSD